MTNKPKYVLIRYQGDRFKTLLEPIVIISSKKRPWLNATTSF